MPKILILYYSMYGHVETLAGAIAEGARAVPGATVTLKRVPELLPEDVARKHGAKLDQAAPIASPKELADYDAILFGTPTRFGNMAAQMRNFLDQTGGLWAKGALVGKVSSVFTSTGTGGGNESTIISFLPTLLHHGMIYVGLPYTCPELADTSEVKGGSPWGAATIAGADGARQPSAKELAQARFQGQHVATVAKKTLRRRRMKAALRLLALALCAAATLWWVAAGASRGWTQNQVPVTTLDEVTGLTGITYESRFVPGLDFLGSAWLGAAALASVSLFGRKTTPNPQITP